ncbi:MAG: galactokinase family protein [Agathobaculum sp.]|uniref:galactokinase n=1 Tax=Agathobaculum sp. TaxID=2048138 RepID=UPI002A81D724|nr:galactokinase family protein [Agathobaculum sp.]MDY3711563.1 galactokinase family protein [Agathobaculum sp.]
MEHLKDRLAQGALDEMLLRLYGAEHLTAARVRCAELLAGFEKTFSAPPAGLFSAPGRTEIGGNHTDHQHGRVLAASVDMDILAAAAPNQSGMIRVQSQGYPLMVVDLAVLTPQAGEENTSPALIRGVAARFAALGCPLQGVGMDVYMTSTVPGGSGLSSSAAFEVLIGTMLNELFWQGSRTAVELAQIGQYAENVFFGKPCGLMDQTASAVGGVVAIDFADTDRPMVEGIGLDLRAEGYALCILDSGADHADLTAEYAAITGELKAVSGYFGKSYLRDVPEQEFLAALPAVRKAAGDRGVLRAFHFYAENQRAADEADALRTGNFERFLALVRASGRSSALYLQNVIPTGQTVRQELMVTIALCERLLAGRGAVRVHGGGFGGTAQAFVPLDALAYFKAETEAVLGAGSCHVAAIRPVGGVRLG